MNVELHDIWISPGHDFKGRHGLGRLGHGVRRVAEVLCHAGKGIEGDRYHGENPGGKTQITFLSLEVVEEMRRT
ncbi:MAG: molybdenum cofactor biosysynthesis protein, partial [Chthoniobacterales bacterium]